VESVKTASDIYAAVSGTVTEINEALSSNPGLVNSDPYIDGWFFKLQLSDPAELGSLLSPQDYQTQISS
jgi:glycine cleavage system H protein